jgi:hypothetical protein
MEELKDKTCICKDCKKKFVFTIKDQKYFGQKGWPDPVRCRVCRERKKISKALGDGVSIADNIKFSEVCDRCGRQFYTKFKRRPGEKMYCEDCWKEIKGI